MNKLSAFADEIGDDLALQIEILKKNDVANIELRGVWGKNVLELSESEVREVKKTADANGIGFSAVGSPLGKFPLDGNFNDQIGDLKRAIDYARIIEAPYIRMFSFYIPEGDDPADHRNQVLDWLGNMVEIAEGTDVILAHENEKDIYGDTGARCMDIYESIQSPSFTGIFDFSNYVQCGDKPYEDCWLKIRKHITYFHVKDSYADTGKVVPAGVGNGDVKKILADAYADGFDNFLTLEPHLSVAEANFGKTSPDLFATAANALKDILTEIGIS
ncbi:MAG: sugar phosphate isomerase/epimerase [Spirochaetales bacterium]|jgi:3-dehydroshikimate dehydratase|nr:sugar phosphate isomerase/epimerase [Spirochaetales bacterium]